MSRLAEPGNMVSIIGGLIGLVVSVLVGGAAIYVGASVVTGEKDYGQALGTSLLGSLALVLLGWIPILGGIVALIVWVGVINWRYEGGWVNAAIIGFVAWLVAVVASIALGVVGVANIVGIPSV
jgi:hypothetical protein